MVAIKGAEADRFLARPAPHIFVYLVFGSDHGLIAERARAIVHAAIDDPKDPFQLLRIGGDDLAADPLRLADEANTIGLFGGRRAVWIEAQGKAFLAALEPLFAAPPRDCAIVIEAGPLKKDSALRRLCEREKTAAAIECFPDQQKDLAEMIDAEARRANVRIGSDARGLLASLLGQDRLTTRAELAKLFLYAHGAAEIDVGDVAAIVSDASGLVADHAVAAAFDGDLTALEAAGRRALTQPADANLLLGAALRHALGLRRARLDLEAGAPPRPTFGPRGQAFDRHLRGWSAARLARAVAILAEAVDKARREPRLGHAIALRALWSIAAMARPQAGRG